MAGKLATTLKALANLDFTFLLVLLAQRALAVFLFLSVFWLLPSPRLMIEALGVQSSTTAKVLGSLVGGFLFPVIMLGIEYLWSIIERKQAMLADAPGARIRTFLWLLFPAKAFDEIFSQIILDMREEYLEALQAGHPRKAQWIVVRGHVSILLAINAYLTVSVVKQIVGMWKLIP